MEKFSLFAAKCAACTACVLMVAAVLAAPIADLRANDMVPPGGNGTNCQNWDPMTGNRRCDPNECYMAPNCSNQATPCRNDGVLPCKICNCKTFTYPSGQKNCECID